MLLLVLWKDFYWETVFSHRAHSYEQWQLANMWQLEVLRYSLFIHQIVAF